MAFGQLPFSLPFVAQASVVASRQRAAQTHHQACSTVWVKSAGRCSAGIGWFRARRNRRRSFAPSVFLGALRHQGCGAGDA